MWTQRQLVDDLKEIGLPLGTVVLVHASMEAIGPIEGSAETLVAAFQETLGAEGTLLVPTFGLNSEIPAESDQLPVFDPTGIPAVTCGRTGFVEAVRRQPGALRSDHPAFSFVAVGADAEALTSHVPFHYPFGSEGSLARLHQCNGWILLIGVGQTENLSLRLAEIWANVPYIHRSALIRTASGEKTTMLGSPECSAGFVKIEPLLRQSRILRRGYIGNAASQLMRQQQTVSMAVAMLQGSPSALLCDEAACRSCTLARRMTAEQVIESN